ncbi:LysR family transcriptional regulator [Campylobacter sp. CCS1377]|uniref:LysR family transcriptional regulator n=1 Tax=Campylobacter sp. CCS1377 TaxID=3158229 RepID=A0AAU7E7F2_9BACT|nr:LysR family transcriptional regulator [Campylobacter jejuni]
MKIKDMEIFLDLLNTQSPTLTANNFSTTQPNISIIIKNLEQQLGEILFERLGKKLLPTPKALSLAQIWSDLVKTYYASLENLNNETLLGEIKIAATQSIAEYFIADILFDFKLHFPKIKIYFQTCNTKECFEFLKKGLVEFCIVESEIEPIILHNEQIKSKLWHQDELIIVSNDKALSQKAVYIDELLNYKWILREQGSGLRTRFLDEINKAGITLPIFLELDRMNAIKELVLNKNALSVLPKKAVEKELYNKTLYAIKLKNIDLKRNFYTLKRKEYDFNPLLDKFEKFLFLAKDNFK